MEDWIKIRFMQIFSYDVIYDIISLCNKTEISTRIISDIQLYILPSVLANTLMMA